MLRKGENCNQKRRAVVTKQKNEKKKKKKGAEKTKGGASRGIIFCLGKGRGVGPVEGKRGGKKEMGKKKKTQRKQRVLAKDQPKQGGEKIPQKGITVVATREEKENTGLIRHKGSEKSRIKKGKLRKLMEHLYRKSLGFYENLGFQGGGFGKAKGIGKRIVPGGAF